MRNIYPCLVMSAAWSLTTILAEAQHAPSKQPTHRPALLRVGVGQSLNGTGDYKVLKAHLEYAPQLGRHWRLGSRLAYIGGNEPYEFGYGFTIPQSYRAVNLEQEIYWLPFGNNKTVEFSLGAGVTGSYAKLTSFSSAWVQDGEFGYSARYERGFQVGYIVSTGLDVALDQSRTWRLGGRLALQNDTRGNILPGAQLQLSRAL
ncbi:hypothetical protein [Hymenobacter swuensis]|uniref:Outer membrane protein beta-barrel domain-containing protein n=1 Tax=Hymenobacter swuensis DY53 TaxID=1227739 RepID=W8EVM1_9BACT|nr:hypothetical protein [Hymenobacter swuensis]AHJ97269.1 hypothetical protein Hsw_1674 [Hymenobacter swuensis DY53]